VVIISFHPKIVVFGFKLSAIGDQPSAKNQDKQDVKLNADS
jgi:hypothetical protein